MVFGFHLVQAGLSHCGGFDRLHPDQSLKQVQGVDGLGEQNATPVTSQSAAPEFVVIGLRAPPGHPHRSGLHFAQAPLRDQLLQHDRGFAKAVLQHHPQMQS